MLFLELLNFCLVRFTFSYHSAYFCGWLNWVTYATIHTRCKHLQGFWNWGFTLSTDTSHFLQNTLLVLSILEGGNVRVAGNSSKRWQKPRVDLQDEGMRMALLVAHSSSGLKERTGNTPSRIGQIFICLSSKCHGTQCSFERVQDEENLTMLTLRLPPSLGPNTLCSPHAPLQSLPLNTPICLECSWNCQCSKLCFYHPCLTPTPHTHITKTIISAVHLN